MSRHKQVRETSMVEVPTSGRPDQVVVWEVPRRRWLGNAVVRSHGKKPRRMFGYRAPERAILWAAARL